MRKSVFGSFFDFNNDGKLDLFEEFMEYQFINDVVMADDHNDDYSVFSDDEDEDSGESNDFSYDDDEADEEDELEAAGLDMFELSLMDEDERRGALEDAGLDEDAFDDIFDDDII